MFEPQDHPRVYGVPLGVDFPKALVDGLTERHRGRPPEAQARVHLIVNTRRMARRIRALFDAGPAVLLPRISLVTDLAGVAPITPLPAAVPPLRRRLELTQLVSALLDSQPDLAPRASLFDLADSLAKLMDEMQGEGVSPDGIDRLDVSDQSGHWERIKSFLGIVRHYFDTADEEPDIEARQRQLINQITAIWTATPPDHPVIIAGSTGSRGATQALMQSVAHLPQGAVILPGFDFDMPGPVWDKLNDPMTSEDHPQYRFHVFARNLGIATTDIPKWSDTAPADAARNRVVSLALRPVPVTDQWISEGPTLRGIENAFAPVTLLEAPSPRIEALSIAMRLRKAAEDGQTAALITPDRTLTRQVAAALDRWDILPDDSAGIPLHLSPPGRFLRHVGDLFREKLSAELLLTLLKHPLTHRGAQRGPHLRLTRELELHLRAKGPPYPGPEDFDHWAADQTDPFATKWITWLKACFTDHQVIGERPLSAHVEAHRTLAERIAQGADGEGAGLLWQGDPGRLAQETVDELLREAPHGGTLGARDYGSLFHAILSRQEVRDPVEPHPNLLIWGTLEARVHGADLLILAGLNEGTWPDTPDPDPWLKRKLRHDAGLLLPERRIGLAAHDFQQAIAAREVWLTRSIRSEDSETVVSRWLNRLQNLLNGLPDQGGTAALSAMKERGAGWLARAKLLEDPGQSEPAPRPAPCPPAEVRPRKLSVTEIKHLIRDPYAIYGKHVLRLRPLDPLMKVPDALLRGVVLHKVLEQFIRATQQDPMACTRERLMAIAVSVLAENVPWAEARATWLARLDRVADWLVDGELRRRETAEPLALEARGQRDIPELAFTLSAKADRIDRDANGRLHLYDYKTGAPPSREQQTYYDKQLLLETAIAEQAGFQDVAPAPVARAVFLGLGSGGKELDAPLESEPADHVWQEFRQLIGSFMDPGTGFTARRAMESKRDRGDYDQLARFGEWDITDPAVKVTL